MKEQSSLGERKVYGPPTYNQTQICRVVSTLNYETSGKVDVVCLDYSQPFPVWVTGAIDRKPEEHDLVLVGYIQGRSDGPYIAGFVRNECYTSNFMQLTKDKITIQLPTDPTDIQGHLSDPTKAATRMRIEVTTTGGITVNGRCVARVGDTVSVNVPGVGTCTGTITSGASTLS